MVFVIAGANSFLGKRMVKLLASNNEHVVIAVVRVGSKSKEFFSMYDNTKVIECNMDDYDKLGVLAGKGDVFINFTWDGSRGEARMNSKLQEYNYLCSISAAKSMLDNGYNILVSAGSQAEYGQIDDIITEETIPRPNTEYGKYKLRIFEELSHLADRYGIRFIEPRYFSLYGPGDYEKTLIMSCIRKMLINEEIVLNPCTQIWDYLYVDDACKALLCLIENKKSFGIYNFASGLFRPLRSYILDIKNALGSNSKVTFGNPDLYNGQIINLQPRIDKLLEDTNGWQPRIPFETGVKEIARDYSNRSL